MPRLRDGALASVAGSLASVPAALLTGRLPAGLELTAFSAQQELDADTLAAALFLYHACLPAQRAPGLAAAAVGFAAVRALSQLRASPGCSAVPLDCGGAALDAAMGANLAASFAVALAAAMSAAAAVLLARQGGPP